MALAADESHLIWFPSYDNVASANITALLEELGYEDYAALDAAVAVDDFAFAAFYEALLRRLDLQWQRPAAELVNLERGIPFAHWFPGAQFNAVENALDRWIERGRGRQPALIWEDEHGSTRSLSYVQVREEMARCACVLKSMGVQKGTTVGLWMPMVPEAAIALLAIGYIGAIAVPAFSGYGSAALATRLNDAGAKVLIAADTLVRRGKRASTIGTLRETAELVPSIENILLWVRLDAAPREPQKANQSPVPAAEGEFVIRHRRGKIFKNVPEDSIPGSEGASIPADPAVDEFMLQAEEATVEAFSRRLPESVKILGWHAACQREAESAPYLRPEKLDADTPYLLLYTSGSTGKPKGTIHPHAGFPLKVAIDQHLCFDLQPGERMLWYTDMGWMMGPFLVLGALMLGATAVLYDGTPDFPAPDRLWAVAARHRVTHLGVAPTAVRALATHGPEWPAKHQLGAIRILGSSGEPWNTAPYKWFLEHIGGGRAPIINYSGGTEIGGGILGCFPTMPLGANAFHGPIPGMRADVVNESGTSIRGGVGELVMRGPWPGMTQSLWGGNHESQDDERFLQTYWERIPGMWTHGDWAEVEDLLEPNGRLAQRLWYIRGRSDDTINVAGKPVGPAEFESVLAGHDMVREAAVIAVPDELKGDVVVCLVVLRHEIENLEALRAELFTLVDHALGHALKPKAIKFVADLPKTRNLKVMRRVARARYLGLSELGDLSGLENLSSLEAIDGAL